MIGANVPPVSIVYGIGESLDTAVTNSDGIAEPIVHVTLRVVPSEMVSFGAGLFSCSVIGSVMSACPDTFTRTVAE